MYEQNKRMPKVENFIKNTPPKLYHIHQRRGVLRSPSNISGGNLESKGSVRKNKKRELRTVKWHFVWLLILRYPYWSLNKFLAFSDQNKISKKITRQGSVRLPDADFFWILPCI